MFGRRKETKDFRLRRLQESVDGLRKALDEALLRPQWCSVVVLGRDGSGNLVFLSRPLLSTAGETGTTEFWPCCPMQLDAVHVLGPAVLRRVYVGHDLQFDGNGTFALFDCRVKPGNTIRVEATGLVEGQP